MKERKEERLTRREERDEVKQNQIWSLINVNTVSCTALRGLLTHHCIFLLYFWTVFSGYFLGKTRKRLSTLAKLHKVSRFIPWGGSTRPEMCHGGKTIALLLWKMPKSNESCLSSSRRDWTSESCTVQAEVQQGLENLQGFSFFGPWASCLFSFICSFYHPYFSCLQSWSDRHRWDYQHAR